jgi:hypothetical protein
MIGGTKLHITLCGQRPDFALSDRCEFPAETNLLRVDVTPIGTRELLKLGIGSSLSAVRFIG